MVYNHISAALDELREAQEQAPLGTQLMLNDTIVELERVLNTFDDDDNAETPETE